MELRDVEFDISTSGISMSIGGTPMPYRVTHLELVTGEITVFWEEDWSAVRSPSRTKRRLARGIPNRNIRMKPAQEKATIKAKPPQDDRPSRRVQGVIW